MNNVLEVNTVNDRLVAALGTKSHQERYAEHLLPEYEFRSHVRPLLLRNLVEAQVSKNFTPAEYKADPAKFKVQERRESKAGLTAEQYVSLQDIKRSCDRETLVIPGLIITRRAFLVEKVVLVDDKEVDAVPMALLEIEVSDPQGRCRPMYLSRRLSL